MTDINNKRMSFSDSLKMAGELLTVKITKVNINSYGKTKDRGAIKDSVEVKSAPKILTDSYQKRTKFYYVESFASFHKVSAVIGLLAYLLATYSFLSFLLINWLNIIFAIPYLVVGYGFVINNLLTLVSPIFSIKKHQWLVSSFWKNNRQPTVDIILPVCGEDIETLRQTWENVKKIDYLNCKVHVGDDRQSEDVRKLAQEFNFNYYSRPVKGEWGKSGNLQYIYDATEGDYIFILDADFKPFRFCLTETIPYLELDDKISILQTPQHFNNNNVKYDRSAIEFGAGYAVEEFYKTMQFARNKFNATVCVGTSAVYRRSGIYNCGGMPKVAASEDVINGLNIIAKKYKIKYLPIVITEGDNPQNLNQHYKQQQRWCSGSLLLPFTSHFKKAKLGFVASHLYFSLSMYYLGEALKPIFSLHLLFLFLIYPAIINLNNLTLLGPLILYNVIIVPLNKKSKNNPASTLITSTNQIFTYLLTIINKLLKKDNDKWVTTGQKVTKVDRNLLNILYIASFFDAVFILSIFAKLFFDPLFFINPNNAIINFLIFGTILNLSIYIAYLIKDISTLEGKIKQNSILSKNWFYYMFYHLFTYLNICYLTFNIILYF